MVHLKGTEYKAQKELALLLAQRNVARAPPSKSTACVQSKAAANRTAHTPAGAASTAGSGTATMAPLFAGMVTAQSQDLGKKRPRKSAAEPCTSGALPLWRRS